VAIYHCTTKPIARSAGRSAVAAAAYRSGSELVDERTGLVHDYTRKGGVVSAELVMPDGGTADRSQLWNAAELAEKRKDSRVAREWIVALPAELNAEQRKELAHAFAGELASRYGVAVDVAIHRPDQEGDQRNHHAHLLTTTRKVSRGANGIELGAKTALELGDKDRKKAGIEGRSAHDIEQLRERWAGLANHALERAGVAERIDHRSLEAQGIDRAPTTHLGPVASEMERRGRASDRGDVNRGIKAENAERARLGAELVDLQAERRKRARGFEIPKAPTAADLPGLEAIWKAERDKLFRPIQAKAQRIQARAERMKAAQARKLQAHEQGKPAELGKLRAMIPGAKEAHAAKLRGWDALRKSLHDRWYALVDKAKGWAEFAREGLDMYPSGGEKLAESRLKAAQPDLHTALEKTRKADQEQRRQKAQEQRLEREKKREQAKALGLNKGMQR
jgi:hypothetical protein